MSDEKRGIPSEPMAPPPPAYSDVYQPGMQQGYPPPKQQGYDPQQGYGQPPAQGYPGQPHAGYPTQDPMQYNSPGQPMMYQQGAPYGQPGYTTTNVVVAPGVMTMSEPPPPDYMGRAIFATLCCFWPVGVFAICRASEARTAYARGDLAGARSNSNSARQLSNIAIVAGIASIVVGLIIMGIYIGVVMNAVYH